MWRSFIKFEGDNWLHCKKSERHWLIVGLGHVLRETAALRLGSMAASFAVYRFTAVYFTGKQVLSFARRCARGPQCRTARRTAAAAT
jgi:hypothetical protein